MCNKSSSLKVCESCLQGKQVRTSYKPSSTQTDDILQIVHTDVCCKMEQQSIGGAVYYVLFLDGFSNKVFVSIMKHKSEVPKIFKEFKKILRSVMV